MLPFDVPAADALARWLQLAALGVIVGAVVAPALDRDVPVARVRLLSRVAGLVALVALFARLLAASGELVDPGESLRASHVIAMLETAWGRGWIVQVASILIVLLVTFDISLPRVSLRERLAALGACVAAPLTGHAMTFPLGAAMGATVTGLHVVAACVWLGTLAALLLLRSAELAPTLKRFAPVALTSAALLVASGLFATWGALGGLPLPARLLSSDYGRVLSAKLVLVACVAGVGGWHWRGAAVRLARGEPETGFLRTAWLEVALAVCVLAVTALLSLMEPPGHG